jgi:hypothetical protein
MKQRLFIFTCFLAFSAIASARTSARPFTILENGRMFAHLASAIEAIGNGKGTILIAPGTYLDCAVQQQGSITYRAIQPGTVHFNGGICEGKAALVLRGREAAVEGLVFENLRVPDGNGAGIRLERGNLFVSGSTFRNSEEGILTHDDPAATLAVDRSTFSRLGRCDRNLDCAHSIYVGHYGRLIITNSRFEAGTGGHYIKSRATRVDIAHNSFDDSQGHLTNYMIDLSNGSTGQIAINAMVQGRDKDNYSAFITIAPEGRDRDSSSLVIRDNNASFATGVSRTSTFIANWTADKVQIGRNVLGPGIKLTDRR